MTKSFMGLCQSKEAAKASEVSKKIDKAIQESQDETTQKLLLLGPGESGKSTCLKQMQILHSNGFTESEIEERRSIVYSNTIHSALDIVNAMPTLGISFGNKSVETDAKILEQCVATGSECLAFSATVKTALSSVWADSGVQEAYNRRSEYQLNDSAKYFLDSIERTGAKDYRPTNQDILQTRIATTGVVKLSFDFKGVSFNVFDAGGQRSERRKWIHFFDDVNAIVFVVAISEYDQTLREDSKTNRLIEAMELFDMISSSKFFVRSSMILFLNKKDLFEEKIKRVSLDVIFPNYVGGLDYNDGIAYIRKQFAKLYHINKQKLYIHETCATDTNQVQHVFNSVIDTIIQDNLKDTGMMYCTVTWLNVIIMMYLKKDD
uniref:Guanine nucleotide-binding protein G(I) subunit alpha n=1 Tax=Panagrellus redivivus TaxID=6233 RepID=A0A7E4UZY5_PANRE